MNWFPGLCWPSVTSFSPTGESGVGWSHVDRRVRLRVLHRLADVLEVGERRGDQGLERDGVVEEAVVVVRLVVRLRLEGGQERPLVDGELDALVGGVDHHAPLVGRAVEPGPRRRVVVDVGGEGLHDVRVARHRHELRCRVRTGARDVDGVDARVERLELGVLGDVERVVRERGSSCFMKSSPGYDSVRSLARSRGVELEGRVRLTVGPVDVVGDGESGHRHRGVDDGFAVAVRLRVAGERGLGPAGRHQVARLGLAASGRARP